MTSGWYLSIEAIPNTSFLVSLSIEILYRYKKVWFCFPEPHFFNLCHRKTVDDFVVNQMEMATDGMFCVSFPFDIVTT